jgi:predicted nucleotidyltransferase
MIQNIETIKQNIVNALIPLEPEKIILFGSYAYGTPHKDSDLDIYIITKDEFIPKNFKEESDIFLKYSSMIRSFQKTIPIDIITHTKSMYKKFISLQSSFAKEIESKGVVLWEKN